MIFSLCARTSSTSICSFFVTRGSLLVRNTSLVAMSWCRIASPSGAVRSSPRLFFPRLECSSSGCTSLPMSATTPVATRPRMASPRSTCSILMTSAPQSESSADAAGTKVCSATSRMRTPCMTSVMTAGPVIEPLSSLPLVVVSCLHGGARRVTGPDRGLHQPDRPRERADRILRLELPVDDHALVRDHAPQHVEGGGGDHTIGRRPSGRVRLQRGQQRGALPRVGCRDRVVARCPGSERERRHVLEHARGDGGDVVELEPDDVDPRLLLEPRQHRVTQLPFGREVP